MTKIKPEKFKLIIGIGNPDPKYKNTYHNIGLMAIDFLSDRSKWAKTKLFEFSKNPHFILAKSSVYMNESGSAVKSALTYFKLKPEEILVIHDDSDILLGQYKLAFNRGPAGHNGIKSIINTIKTEKIWRFRIGARKIYKNRLKAAEFILKTIETKDKKILQNVFENLKTCVETDIE